MSDNNHTIEVVKHPRTGELVVRLDRGRADYVLDNGVIYSVGGGWFESPRHTDSVRWRVLNFPSTQGEELVIEYFTTHHGYGGDK